MFILLPILLLWVVSKSLWHAVEWQILLIHTDPTYMVRAIPSNASDNVYCTLLAHSAIHGAMAGYCGFTAGPVNNRHCYIPIPVSAPCRTLYVQAKSFKVWVALCSQLAISASRSLLLVIFQALKYGNLGEYAYCLHFNVVWWPDIMFRE